MPAMTYPKSDANRVQLLNKIIEETNRDLSVGRPTVPAFYRDEMAHFATTYTRRVHYLKELRYQRAHSVERKNTVLDKLKRFVRDFWEGLSRRIIRDELTTSLYTTYGLPLDGKRPVVTTGHDWLSYGEQIIVGEVKAIEDGFDPMSNPSAAEVETWVVSLRVALEAVADADAALDAEQHMADQDRQACDVYLRKASRYLDIALYEMPADDVQHIKSRYGYEYRYSSDADEQDEGAGVGILPAEESYNSGEGQVVSVSDKHHVEKNHNIEKPTNNTTSLKARNHAKEQDQFP